MPTFKVRVHPGGTVVLALAECPGGFETVPYVPEGIRGAQLALAGLRPAPLFSEDVRLAQRGADEYRVEDYRVRTAVCWPPQLAVCLFFGDMLAEVSHLPLPAGRVWEIDTQGDRAARALAAGPPARLRSSSPLAGSLARRFAVPRIAVEQDGTAGERLSFLVTCEMAGVVPHLEATLMERVLVLDPQAMPCLARTAWQEVASVAVEKKPAVEDWLPLGTGMRFTVLPGCTDPHCAGECSLAWGYRSSRVFGLRLSVFGRAVAGP